MGYDIKSFGIKNGQVVEKYIEVKTTLGADKDFEITATEVEKSKSLSNEGIYAIARVYNLDMEKKSACYYYEEGNFLDNYDLQTSIYIARKKV